MKKIFAAFATFLYIISGCGQDGQSSLCDGDFIRVDVTANYPKKELILQDFMDVEYIPLETNEEFVTSSLIRAITEEIIIIHNRGRFANGDIFIFDRSGKGVRKINRKGQGGEEYMNIGGITLDEQNGEIYVNSHWSRKIIVYDLFGNFKRSFPHKEGTFYFPIRHFNQDHLIVQDGENTFYEEIKANSFSIISKQDGSVIMEIPIPFQEKKMPGIMVKDGDGNIINDAAPYNPDLIPFRDSWILVEPSSDTICRLGTDYSLKPFIVKTPSIQSLDPEVFLYPSVLTDRYYFM